MPRQNTPPSAYPQAVLRQIEALAQNIAVARKRRGESQAQWARKLGISQPTMTRIERGDPSVAMASYVMCLWLINQAEGLADLIAPQNDHAALEKEVAKVRAKGAPSKRPLSSKPMGTAEPLPTDLVFSRASPPRLPDLARPRADPMAQIRKSQVNTGNPSATVKGLAALMAKPSPQNND